MKTMSLGVATASAATQYEGTVVGKSVAEKTFRLRDSERGTIRIKVRRSTRFERIDGLRGLKLGMNRVEAIVKRSRGRVAIEIERSGGGGEHGGDNRRDDD